MHEKIVLDNGLRIVSEKMDSVRSCAIGVWLNTGSRNETVNEQGNAHFIEHMMFKGTSKYTAQALASKMDSLGGQFNAFTTREATCYYARVLDYHLDETIDILADMLLDSNLDEEDIKNELTVIFEEIDMYEDVPEDLLSEQLFEVAYPCAVGRPVLGDKDCLASQTSKSLREFMDKNYIPERIVVSLAGSFSQENIDKIAERFGKMPKTESRKMEKAVYKSANIVRSKEIEQNHLMLCYEGVSLVSDDRFTAAIMSTILGGGASSRLFQNIREKHGLCYSIYSFSSSFVDSGLFGIAIATNAESEEKVLRLIMAEVKDLVENGVTDEELARAIEQTKVSILMSLESTPSRMNRLANGEVFRGNVMTQDEVIEKYEAITKEDILVLARKILRSDKLSISAIGKNVNEAMYVDILESR